MTLGAFKRPGINHLLPAINVVGNSALARQKDPTDMAPLKTMWSFCCGKAISLSKFMTGNKWLISVRVNAPIENEKQYKEVIILYLIILFDSLKSGCGIKFF